MVVFLLIAALITSEDLTAQPSSWTVQTLKEYTDQRFNALETAVTKQENAYNDRFDNTNEWRASYEDLIKVMQRDYLPRSEFEALKESVSEIKAELNRIQTLKEGGSTTVAYIAMGIGLLVGLIALSRNFIASVLNKQK